MLKYLILFIFIFLCFSCSGLHILYKEKTRNSKLRILEDRGPGYTYITIQKKVNRQEVYHITYECQKRRYDNTVFRNRIFAQKIIDLRHSPDNYTGITIKDKRYYGYLDLVTDTTNGYFIFDAKISDKNDSLAFVPLDEEEKKCFAIAGEKSINDSCRCYNMSKIIGFIPKRNTISWNRV